MKFRCLSIISAIILTSGACLAQMNQPAVEDFQPASTNQPGKQYPQVNSKGRVRASISAPQAQKVQLMNGLHGEGAYISLLPCSLKNNPIFINTSEKAN